jgi:magnesium chelatase family protein
VASAEPMHGRCRSVALAGMDGTVVEVEAHLGGLPGFVLVGRPDAGMRECRDRVRAAVLSSREPWPQQRITASLSPAGVPKHGSHFDLPLAVAILVAAGRVPQSAVEQAAILGELGLDGRLRPVRGVLPAVAAAVAGGCTAVIVPESNLDEARQVPGVSVVAPRSLAQLVALLRGDPVPDADVVPTAPHGVHSGGFLEASPATPAGDLSEVIGQPVARLAMEVAAAGRHHVCLVGPPGCGKTMLAERLPGLLPDLAVPERYAVSSIHSLAGVLDPAEPLVSRPPFVNPHHTASAAAVVGGGSPLARPGAVSLAHRGVLLLDEAPEFNRRVLESLRQPLESGVVELARAAVHARFPAQFQLVLTANPCPCGNHGSRRGECTCTPMAVRQYRQRLSGPLLDRVDLRVSVPPVSRGHAGAEHDPEPTAVVSTRVRAARERQHQRLAAADLPYRCNGDVPSAAVRRALPLPAEAARVLDDRVERGRITARAAARVARVAWTIADLGSAPQPTADHVGQAVALHQQGTP